MVLLPQALLGAAHTGSHATVVDEPARTEAANTKAATTKVPVRSQAAAFTTENGGDSSVVEENVNGKEEHQKPAGICLVCYEPLEQQNYAEYCLSLSASPQPTKAAKAVVSATITKKADENDPAESEDRRALSEVSFALSNAEGASKQSLKNDLHDASSDTQSVKNDDVQTGGEKPMLWYPAQFCTDCIEELQASQFKRYCDSVATTTCAREQRSLLQRGPPIKLRDRMAFPLSNDEEIHLLWYAKDDRHHSAKLEDSKEGEERQVLWDKLRQFLIEDEDEEEANDKEKRTEEQM